MPVDPLPADPLPADPLNRAQPTGRPPSTPAGHPLGRRLRELRKSTRRMLGTRFGAIALRRLWAAAAKTRLHDDIRRRLREEQGPCVLAFWHGRGVLTGAFHGPETTDVLVSASEDGTMATEILHGLGYHIIRGSSSKYGVRALREMIESLQGGMDVAITPDGPRGPMHGMSQGVVFMSKATRLPVLPLGLAVDRAWRLDSWDHYAIPKLRAEIVACYGEPLQVPRETPAEGFDEYARIIRDRLRSAEREAFAHLGRAPDWADWVPDAPPADWP